MHKKTLNRLIITIFIALLVIIGIVIILYNFNKNITFFYPPSEIPINYDQNKLIRIGGLVKEGSINKLEHGEIKFFITDDKAEVEVFFKGMIPILFREKQGVVVKGRLNQNLFIAEELLTKHDEKYYP